MIRINLLPHRESFRQQQIIEHIIVFLLVVAISVAITVGVDMSITKELTSLQEERLSLEQRNKVLSKKIGELRNLDSLRADVESKLQIVDELQAGRFRSLETLNEIASVMPKNVWLQSLADEDGVLMLDGFGESSQSVANFMRALDKSEVFDDVQLLVDKSAQVEDVKVRSFSLSFRRLTLAEQAANAKRKSDKEVSP